MHKNRVHFHRHLAKDCPAEMPLFMPLSVMLARPFHALSRSVQNFTASPAALERIATAQPEFTAKACLSAFFQMRTELLTHDQNELETTNRSMFLIVEVVSLPRLPSGWIASAHGHGVDHAAVGLQVA